MLLTRSPLSPGPKSWFSLDLHVLSAPPAFVLSQDQTLREEIIRRHEAGRSDPLELLRFARRALDVVFQRKRRRVHFRSRADARERSRRFTLLSFQRPRRHQVRHWHCGQQKTSDSHQRPSGTEQRKSYPLARRLSPCRVTGFLHPPRGRPGDRSTGDSPVNQAVPGVPAQPVRRAKRLFPA